MGFPEARCYSYGSAERCSLNGLNHGRTEWADTSCESDSASEQGCNSCVLIRLLGDEPDTASHAKGASGAVARGSLSGWGNLEMARAQAWSGEGREADYKFRKG